MTDFHIKRRIYYHNTDSGGVVYYGRYLDFFEEGRTELLREKGIEVAEYLKRGVGFAVVRAEIDYKRPARYGEEISVITRIEDVGRASIRFFQEIKKDDTTLTIATIILACIGSDFKPKLVPDDMKKALS
ncbi:MAG: acyl-CoA thioesterase [Candidatus Omnitrophica bacterium]|nr:acyl-CoA thioesterase [Candidatus Omnitrophota bacterium]MBU4487787.1 acyl-CoA thioesterase [Candidatus Omnitrophota bacterium]MCG2705573.1 acyl-CoA thioesterase [Candidatus Omnitrophota bacterium]